MNTIQHYIHKKPKGFTIVELLIVIVVIAILAAIGIVAYTGIQTRTLNSARAQEVRQWERLLTMYHAEHSEYPVSSGRHCLGEGFPVVGDRQACNDLFSGGTIGRVNDELNNVLAGVGSLPQGTREPVVASDGERIGSIFQIEGSRAFIYQFYQSTTCELGSRTWGTENVSLCRIELPGVN